MEKEVKQCKIKPVDEDDLPPEFKKFDKPFGLEQHVFNFVIGGVIYHAITFYYFLYLWPFGIVSRWSLLYATLSVYVVGLGTTVGAHRLWTHKTFKANLPLKIILMFLQTAAMQYPIFKWCKDHRIHHKYMDTDADPYNSSRGFWFSHITWLFQPKHPELEEKLRTIDISDLASDPVVRFQCKYYWELVMVAFFVVPMSITHLFFPDMSLFHVAVINIVRYVMSLHFTFLVNSAAHMWGTKPYDKHISPTENALVAILASGEGWHNYHHTFPWDYQTAEYGYWLNTSTIFIDFFAMIGWATDLKTVSQKLLNDRISRTGDGSHALHQVNDADSADTDWNKYSKKVEAGLLGKEAPPAWGWGDDALSKEDILITETLFQSKFRRRSKFLT